MREGSAKHAAVARQAVLNVIGNGIADDRLEAAAITLIEHIVAPRLWDPNPVAALVAALLHEDIDGDRIAATALLGEQIDLRDLPLSGLLAPVRVDGEFVLPDDIDRWVRRAIYGSATYRDDRRHFERDLGLDSVAHADRLRHVRKHYPDAFRALERCRLGRAYRLLTSAADLPSWRARAVIAGHGLILSAVQARMVGEYLRRLAAGLPHLDAGAARPGRGSALMRVAIEPAALLSNLGRRVDACGEDSDAAMSVATAIETCGYPALPAFAGLVDRVYRRVKDEWAHRIYPDRAGPLLLTRMRSAITPATGVTMQQIRDEELGREGFVEAEHGVTPAQGCAILAAELADARPRIATCLDALDNGHPTPVAAPARWSVRNPIRRMAITLKNISDCQRASRPETRAHHADDKVGRGLVAATRKVLAQEGIHCTHMTFRIDPVVWFQEP